VKVLSFREAQDKARDWLRTVEGGVAVKASYTVGDALDDYLEAFAGKDLVNTRRRVEQFVRPALGNVKLSRLTAAQVRGFLTDRANTPARLRTRKGKEQQFRPLDSADAQRKRRATANRDLTVLKAALNMAFTNGRIASDHAWKTVKPFKNVDGARLRYLTDEEARRVVNAVGPEFRPIVQASLLTGARWGELRNVTVADVDLQAATVMLMETKGGQPRDCAVHQAHGGEGGRRLRIPGPERQALVGRDADSANGRRMRCGQS